MNLLLTELAELRLRTFLRRSTDAPQPGIRVGVSDGGCSGFEYSLKMAAAPRPNDIVIENGSLKVYVDPTSAPLLDGIVIDYVEGLLESGFKFSNPNATDTCSCGKSFRAGECTPAAAPCP